MNAYVIDVFAFLDADEDSPPTCLSCYESQSCARVVRKCWCGPSQKVGPQELAKALSGVRFPGLNAEDAYCVRAVAVQIPATYTSISECICKDRWLNPSFAPPPVPGGDGGQPLPGLDTGLTPDDLGPPSPDMEPAPPVNDGGSADISPEPEYQDTMVRACALPATSTWLSGSKTVTLEMTCLDDQSSDPAFPGTQIDVCLGFIAAPL
jgi:hypothetical protein